MQVAPIKPTLKAPGTTRLKLKYYEVLSSFAFKFNLRRYTKSAPFRVMVGRCSMTVSIPVLKCESANGFSA
jgi:hypothetical protein